MRSTISPCSLSTMTSKLSNLWPSMVPTQRKKVVRSSSLNSLTGPDQTLPPAVKAKHGTSRAGQPVHYYFNFSPAPHRRVYPYAAGRELLSNRALPHGSALNLDPWGVAIVEQPAP